jgi:iron-sulfur cluster insertion protein
MLRVAVLGGGCSGFQYNFSLDDKENDDDLRIVRDDAVILIDETSVSLLQGSEVDYYEGLDGSMFTISNPNATSSCGCGTSFAI